MRRMPEKKANVSIKKEKTPAQKKIIAIQKELQSNAQEPSDEEAVLITKHKSPEQTFNDNTAYIKKNINVVMEVAKRLYEVLENKLFRLKYNSFKEYVNEEFNYTRGRAYQLTRAYDVAEYINKNAESEEDILTTEPQCRELLKVKVYTDDSCQKVDEARSNKERLTLIKEIITEKENITTKMIVDKVREKLAAVNQDADILSLPERCNKSIKRNCDNVLKMMKNLIKTTGLSADDIVELKKKAKDDLENLITDIEAYGPDLNN